MGYPGGGRSVITMRLQSRSNLLNITFPAEAQLKRIFSLPLQQKLEDFEEEVKGLCDALTSATMNLYFGIAKELVSICAHVCARGASAQPCQATRAILRSGRIGNLTLDVRP